MQFDIWQRWGIDLDDASFARAWAALGVAGPRNEERSVTDLGVTRWAGSHVRWTFPPAGALIEGKPAAWAEAWPGAWERMFEKPVRLRVRGAPPDEPILPWLRILREAVPAPAAVSLDVDAPRAQLDVELPLRLGSLTPAARRVTGAAHALWPANELTRLVTLDRATPRCDLLVHPGPPRTLLQELLANPAGIKANLILLSGGGEAEWGATDALLGSILAETRASGFVIARAVGEADLGSFVNEIVFELSHARPVDEAVAAAAQKQGIPVGRDFVAGFTPALADFRVPELVDKYNARIEALPPGSEVAMAAPPA
ncbi:MAG TPA: hypothetical protein VGF40_07835, partial [Thermoanaerobaculia bacterium]